MGEYSGSRAIKPQCSKAVAELIEIGFLPSECTRFELVIDAKDVIRAKCEFNVTEEQMQVLVDALKRNPEEVADMLRTAEIKVADYRVGHREMERIPDLRF